MLMRKVVFICRLFTAHNSVSYKVIYVIGTHMVVKFLHNTTERNSERIELEKNNAALSQQVASMKEENERLRQEKLEKVFVKHAEI